MTVDDIGPDTDWRSALAGVDAVVHLAARAHVLRDSSADAHALYRAVNTLGALRLAEAAAAAEIRRFVFLSSARVHGNRTTGVPFTESSPLLAEDPYGRSKADAERGLAALGATGRLEPMILRPPLVYGPGARGNFARLVALVARGVPLPLGAVRNRRSLIFVGNLVDAIVRSLDHPAAAGETFLVSDGEDLSTPDLVRRIARALGKPARLVPVRRSAPPPRRHARRPLRRRRAPARRSRRGRLQDPRVPELVAGLYAGRGPGRDGCLVPDRCGSFARRSFEWRTRIALTF